MELYDSVIDLKNLEIGETIHMIRGGYYKQYTYCSPNPNNKNQIIVLDTDESPVKPIFLSDGFLFNEKSVYFTGKLTEEGKTFIGEKLIEHLESELETLKIVYKKDGKVQF